MNSIPCKVCDNLENNKMFEVKEMYLGLREKFVYQHCGNCGLMQLLNIPENLSKYYPPDKYYSFKSEVNKKVKPELFRKIKAEYLLHNKNRIAGKLLSLGYKVPEYFEWLKKTKVHLTDAILDVGCGNGGLLISLNKMGFTNLTGIDPFNENDLDYGDIKIYKKTIFETEGEYDLIMLNHVLEHMDEAQNVINRLYDLLKNGKYLLIRTPVMESYAWHKYHNNWMNLDAPRHLIIHTIKSIKILCERSGFILKDIVFDATADSLIGSEQYQKNIALIDEDSYLKNRKSKLFSEKELEDFKIIANEKNKTGEGDQAAFYLYKP